MIFQRKQHHSCVSYIYTKAMQNVINSEAVPGMNFHSLASSCAMIRSESIKAQLMTARESDLNIIIKI